MLACERACVYVCMCGVCVYVCLCVYVCACVRLCVRACVRTCATNLLVDPRPQHREHVHGTDGRGEEARHTLDVVEEFRERLHNGDPRDANPHHE